MTPTKRSLSNEADRSKSVADKKSRFVRDRPAWRSITLKDITEDFDLSFCKLEFYVEYVIPPQKYEKDGTSDGTVYKCLLSDGESIMIEAVAFGVFGQKISKKLERNKCYMIKGDMKIKRRDIDFVSESNSNLELHLGEVNVLHLEDSPTQTCGFISVKELNTLIFEEDRFIKRLKNVVITDGTEYKYLGCPECCSKISDKEPHEEHFYCSSKSWKCSESQQKPRERKELMIFHSINIQGETGEDLKEEFVIFDSLCRDLAEFIKLNTKTEEEEVSLTRLIGSTVDLRIKGYTPKDSSHCRLEILDAYNIRLSQQDVNDEEDAEPFSSSSGGSDSSGNYDFPPEPEPPVEPFKRVSLSDKVDTSTECCYPRDDSKPRGLVMFINIETVTLPNGESDPRKGSHRDWIQIKQTLGDQLGYDFFKGGLRNLPSTELEEEIAEFKTELIKKDYPCMMLIISTHGCYDQVTLGDGVTINPWTDLVYPFRETDFPEFESKPKIFISNACLTFEEGKKVEKKIEGSTKDIFVLLSCMPGYTSFRHPGQNSQGSWFLYFLMQAITEHYFDMHLTQIMREVQKKQHEWSKNLKKKYQVGIYLHTLCKKFYF